MHNRFLGRHASVIAAMVAHGISEPEARSLIEHATAAGRLDIPVPIGGRVLNFRLVRGSRCDVHVLQGQWRG